MSDPVRNESVVPLKRRDGLNLPVNTTMQVDLGGGRVISFQTSFSQEESAQDQAALLARLAHLGDGLRLRYDVKTMKKTLVQQEVTTRSLEEDLERIDARQASAYEARMKDLAESIVRVQTEAEERHKKSGRSTQYRPEGATATKLAQLNTELTMLKNQGGPKLSETDKANRENALVTLARHKEKVQELRTEIEEAEATLNGSG